MNIVQPFTWPDINARMRAASPEGVPHWLYSTQTYTDNSTTALTFFTATDADESLTNQPSGGVLPADNVLFIHNIYVDYLNAASGVAFVSTAAGGVTGFIDDVGKLHMTGRGRLLLKIRSKDYGPWPLAAFQGLGGVAGFGWGTFTAEESLQYAHNALGVGSGRGCIGGAIAIPAQVQFKVQIVWPAAVDLTGDYRVRVTLHGALYRNIQ